MIVPVTSVTKDAATLTRPAGWSPEGLELPRVGIVGGRAEYFMTGPNGEKWSGSWKFTAVNPISSFEAYDGDDNADDPNGPASMTFTFDTTPTGSRMTCVTRFLSLDAMAHSAAGMEEGLRAAMPQLDAVLAEPSASAAHA